MKPFTSSRQVKNAVFSLFNTLKLPVICLSLAFVFLANAAAEGHQHQDGGNRFGSHGMALLSDGTALYASHMPLYRKPHDYQIVYKIDVEPKIKALLLSEQSGLMSILPDNFDLDRLINGEKLEINANIYQGHFERGGQLWLKDIELKFTQPIYVRGLQVKQLKDSSSEVVYEQVELANQRVLLVRHITRSPSADHLMILTPKNTDDSNVQCKFQQATSMEKVTPLNLDIHYSVKRNQDAIQSIVSECFEVLESYWETADFNG